MIFAHLIRELIQTQATTSEFKGKKIMKTFAELFGAAVVGAVCFFEEWTVSEKRPNMRD